MRRILQHVHHAVSRNEKRTPKVGFSLAWMRNVVLEQVFNRCGLRERMHTFKPKFGGQGTPCCQYPGAHGSGRWGAGGTRALKQKITPPARWHQSAPNDSGLVDHAASVTHLYFGFATDAENPFG